MRAEAAEVQLPVNADIQTKVLKAGPVERKMLLSSLPRFTLMLYEVSSPGDGNSPAEKIEKLRAASQRFLDMAYEGLSDTHLAQMTIALRTRDYGELLPLDAANSRNPHYRGWARHSYNDTLRNVTR